jgi:hypothetical protein
MRRRGVDAGPPSRSGPWTLRSDLLTTHVLLWVVGAGRLGKPTPDVHLYLYDRYWRLAHYHAERGNVAKASRLRSKAEEHFTRSGYPGPRPPAAAMAMPHPRPPIVTWAVARDRLRGKRSPRPLR